MTVESNAKLGGWSRLFVRHAKEDLRLSVADIADRIKPPFCMSSGCVGCRLDSIKPWGKWLVGLRVANESWLPLFSNAADADLLFKTVAKSRCLEAVLVGHDPVKRGWYVQVNREGRRTLDFALPVRHGDQIENAKFTATDISASVLQDCSSGKAAVDRLCHELQVNPAYELVDSDGELCLLGNGGKPHATGKVVCFEKRGYALTCGENPASDALKEAIDKCDPKAIQEAVAQGARLDVLPDTSSSPLSWAFHKCGQPRGKDCVAMLAELGCSINGQPHEDPMVFKCVFHIFAEAQSLEMLKTFVSLGGNVNAIDRRTGNTALLTPVVYRRKSVVWFLLEQGVDPTIKNCEGQSVVDWLENRLKRGGNNEAERRDYATILSMCTGQPVEGVSPVGEALSTEQSAVVRQEITKMASQSSISDDLGVRPEHLEPLRLGIEQALGISIQPIVDGVNVRTTIDEKGNVSYDSLERIQAYLSKWRAPLKPTPFLSLFTIQTIEAMVAKALEEKSDEPAAPTPLAPEHFATLREMIAKTADVPVAELKPSSNLFSDLKINSQAVGVLFVRINLKWNIDILPIWDEIETEFQVDRQGRLTESSLRRLKRILPGCEIDAAKITSLDDLFTIETVEAIVAKSLARRPADLPCGGIQSDEQREWVRQLPAQLGEHKLRLFLARACKYAFEPQGKMEHGVVGALAALERFADTGESKRALRDLRRQFWQEWRVEGDPSHRALHEALDPNDSLPAVTLVTQAIAESHKLSEQEAVREIRRLHKDLFSPE